jgi:hypothetical protein
VTWLSGIGAVSIVIAIVAIGIAVSK